jgi:ATP-dependent RNA helicase DeaD
LSSAAFDQLGLSQPILTVLNDVGYESPSPIQAESIPPLLQGLDLLGQAQTGTGKTAAFALPLLSRLDLTQSLPQVLVLTPTRELAIQVAEAFQRYAHYLKGFHVLPLYGGQAYDNQLRQLKRGVHVVVGTPGRVMDHMRRGTLVLDNLSTLVLDEADEMLRMGFIDDVEWILEHTPDARQIALFSATIPSEIRHVAKRYLKNPVEIKIASKTTTATNINQYYWPVTGLHKLDALTRILEVENFDAVLIFVRTKVATEELADKLLARGYACEALNGDISQKLRERTIEKLKAKQIDIVVATDVAARGLDVSRISHVINFDIPYDIEAYVHRIGRTGRAGRSGEAILFVSPRERRLLAAIEKNTRQKIQPLVLPSVNDINEKRISKFKQNISKVLAEADLDLFYRLITEYEQEFEADPMQIAAALAYMVQGDVPLLLKDKPLPVHDFREQTSENPDKPRPKRNKAGEEIVASRALPLKHLPELAMVRYRIDAGYAHDIKPSHVVGTIANEGDIDSQYIGHIEIYDEFTCVDLPAAIPAPTLLRLQKAFICGRRMNLQPLDDNEGLAGYKTRPVRKSKKPNKGKRKSY